MPRALSATTDAQSAIVPSALRARTQPHTLTSLRSLPKVFHAPLMRDASFTVDPAQKLAVEVRDATFEWGESIREGGQGGGGHREQEFGQDTLDAEQVARMASFKCYLTSVRNETDNAHTSASARQHPASSRTQLDDFRQTCTMACQSNHTVQVTFLTTTHYEKVRRKSAS